MNDKKRSGKEVWDRFIVLLRAEGFETNDVSPIDEKTDGTSLKKQMVARYRQLKIRRPASH